jgi:hypothetical protein
MNAGNLSIGTEKVLKPFLEIAVCLFPVVDFKDMNDQDVIMDCEKGTNVPPGPKRIHRMVWI